MTSSNGNIFRVTGPLCGECTGPGEFPTQRPVTRSFDVCFDLRLNNQLSKQPWGWWFETPSWSLWRHCNGCTSFANWYHQIERNHGAFGKMLYTFVFNTTRNSYLTTTPRFLWYQIWRPKVVIWRKECRKCWSHILNLNLEAVYLTPLLHPVLHLNKYCDMIRNRYFKEAQHNAK